MKLVPIAPSRGRVGKQRDVLKSIFLQDAIDGTETMTVESPALAPDAAVAQPTGRWGQLIVGVLCMVMIANLQYGWTLFVNPIDQKYHWGTAAIQVAFSVFKIGRAHV